MLKIWFLIQLTESKTIYELRQQLNLIFGNTY